jgi:hypothetical protein
MRFLQQLENTQNLFEEAGSFADLPPKWVKELARRRGGKDSVTSSTVAQVNGVKQAKSVIKKALSNIDDTGAKDGVIAVAVFADNDPVFLVYQGYDPNAVWRALLVDTEHTKSATRKLTARNRRAGTIPLTYKSFDFKINELIDSLISVLDQLGYDLQNVKLTLKEFHADTVRASIKNKRAELQLLPNENDEFRSMSNRAIRRKAAEYAIEKAESKVQELLANISIFTNGQALDAREVITDAINGSIDIPDFNKQDLEKAVRSLSSLGNFLNYIKLNAEDPLSGWASRNQFKRAKDGTTSWITTPKTDIDKAFEYYLK